MKIIIKYINKKNIIKYLIIFITILLILFISQSISVKQKTFKEKNQTNETIQVNNISSLVLISIPTPQPTPQPTPDYIPTLRPYKINKNHDIWHAQDPMSYITPDNEWVKYYASQVYINEKGEIRYKNERVPRSMNLDGSVETWQDKLFENNYVSDIKYPDNDLWVMPEYYLTNNMSDDCDGWAITISSMMLSGEMSVKKNDKFEKQVIPSKVVIGYIKNDVRDAWVEYNVNDKIYFTTTDTQLRYTDAKIVSITIFTEKSNRYDLKPMFEFTDKYFKNSI